MNPIVKTLQGAVRGCEGWDLNNNKYYKFLGIPFAKPPVGDLRFKDPQPPDSWIEIRDATREATGCGQKNFLTQEFEGSEDCLYLNVFTKDLPDESDNLKPVMVWIHGGAFVSGSNSEKIYGSEFLISEDVVMVSINYRLGLLGFLRIKDENLNVTGNMGFKDQVEALRWVKYNIIQFNGDPNNITIFGESAGAASVHYHILSPLSRGLFHKAILQSGSALNPWSDECDHNSVAIARIRNKHVDTEKEALKFLKGLSLEELYGLQTDFLSALEPGAMRPFGLVIEKHSKKNSFISKRPIDIIVSGEYNKVPMIFGYNNREGIIFNEMRKTFGDPKESQPENFLPYNVTFRNSGVLRRNYVDKLKNLYFRGLSEDENIISVMGDAWFVAGILGSVKNHAQTSAYPIYVYKFSLDTKLNVLKIALKCSHVPGCSHGDDIGYIFKTIITPPIEEGTLEDLSRGHVLRLWTNFAKFSNPTPEQEELGIIWKPVKARQINTLHIQEELTMEVNPENKRMDLWREIYNQSPYKYL